MAKRKKPRDEVWGERICELMADAERSVAELVAELEVARSTVYTWRDGTRIPSRIIQPRLAKALHTTVARLNGWTP